MHKGRDAPSERTTDESVADIAKNIRRDWMLLLIILPGVLYFAIFLWSHVWNLMAFKDYNISRGVWEALGGTEAF